MQAGGQHWLTEKNDEEPTPPVPPSAPTPDDKLYASGTSHETPLPSQPIHGKEASVGVRVAYILRPDGGMRCDWDLDAHAALPAKLAGYLFPCARPLCAEGSDLISMHSQRASNERARCHCRGKEVHLLNTAQSLAAVMLCRCLILSCLVREGRMHVR